MTIAIQKPVRGQCQSGVSTGLTQGSNFLVNITPPITTDAIYTLHARVVFLHQTGGATSHLDTAASLYAESVFLIANTTISQPAAATSAENPTAGPPDLSIQENTVAMCKNIVNALPSIAWSVGGGGSQFTLTITNGGTGGTVDVGYHIWWEYFSAA